MVGATKIQLPSFRDCAPTEDGGSIARAGFAYQDHVAVRFCFDLLSDPTLIEVCCETYDDVVLVRSTEAGESVELVQVKSDGLDQLWTVSILCQREAKKTGTSIFERSLNRSRFSEPCTFRLVTSQNIAKELSSLRLARDHKDRLIDVSVERICKDISIKCGEVTSPSGQNVESWVRGTLWEVFSDSSIVDTNKISLCRHLEAMGVLAVMDVVDNVYESILSAVKRMAELRNTDRDKKVMTRDAFVSLVKKADDPFPNASPSERLTAKLSSAGCDSICIDQAQDLRRAYHKSKIKKPFLNLDGERDDAEAAILGKLHHLLSGYDSDRIPLPSDKAFHDKCIEEIGRLGGSKPEQLPPHLALGCMYEIASRCRHRFTRVAL